MYTKVESSTQWKEHKDMLVSVLCVLHTPVIIYVLKKLQQNF